MDQPETKFFQFILLEQEYNDEINIQTRNKVQMCEMLGVYCNFLKPVTYSVIEYASGKVS